MHTGPLPSTPRTLPIALPESAEDDAPRTELPVAGKARSPVIAAPFCQDVKAGREGIAKMQNGALADVRRLAPAPLPAVVGDPEAWHAGMAGNRWVVADGSNSTFAGNRGCVNFMQAVDINGTTSLFSVGFENTGLGLAYGQYLIHNQANSLGLQGAGWGEGPMRGAALGAGWIGASGWRASADVALIVFAETELRALANPDGEPPAGKRLVEWRSFTMPILAVNLSSGYSFYGFGPRAAITRAKQAVYRKYIDKAVVANVLQQRDAQWCKTIQRGCEALGLKKAPVAVPKLADAIGGDPLHALQPGEQVSYSDCRTFTIGFNGSAYGVRVGSFVSFAGETEVTLRRLDASTVELELVPKKFRSLMGACDTLILTESSITRTVTLAMRQVFRFDLTHAAAREALDLFAAKRIAPSAGARLRAIGEDEEASIVGDLRDQKMPKGVTWLLQERGQRREVRAGAGIPKPFFVRGTFAGLGYWPVWGRDENVAPHDATHVRRIRGRDSDKQTQLLWRGTKSHKARGEVTYVTPISDAAHWSCYFNGMELQLKFKLDRVRGMAREQARRKLQHAVGVDIPAFTRPGHKQSYEVTLTLPVDPKGLAQLRRADLSESESQASAAGGSVKAMRATQFAMGRASLPGASERPEEALAKYVAKERTNGFAAIFRLLGSDVGSLGVKVKSSSYGDGLGDDLALLAQLIGEVRPAEAKALAFAQKLLKKLTGRLETGLLDLRDDAIWQSLDSAGFGKRLALVEGWLVQAQGLQKVLDTPPPPPPPVDADEPALDADGSEPEPK